MFKRLIRVVASTGFYMLVVFPLVASANAIPMNNGVPDAPGLKEPAHRSVVSLTPNLSLQPFASSDGDNHAGTRYQIALDMAFTDLVFDRLSSVYLTDWPLMDLILDPDTTYYWRARFIDSNGGESLWSTIHFFTTMDYLESGDEDANGILDNQEVEDLTVDLDGNQIADAVQNGMMCVATTDGVNPYVSIAASGSQIHLVGLRSLVPQDIGSALYTNTPDTVTGLINYKVLLQGGNTAATLTVYFSAEVPENATYYNRTEQGWVAYSNSVFSPDRRSVTITLEDGGAGDQDGVVNGIIVDPAGLGLGARAQSGSAEGFEVVKETTCFIQTLLFTY